jgi:hypothetical protein
MVYRYYHWRCSEADILGGEDVNAVVETGSDTPREFSEYMTVSAEDSNEEEDKPVERYTINTAPGCYGHFDNESECFEEDCANIRTSCAEEAGYDFVGGEYVKKAKKKKMKV